MGGEIMKEQKKTHTGAYALILNEDKIVLIKKARGGYIGKLDLPGGGIEHNETPLEAVIRECQEEAGVNIENSKLFIVCSNTFKWQMTPNIIENLHHLGILYTAECNNQVLKNDADGLDSFGAEWYAINDLQKDQLSPFAYQGLIALGYKID